MISRRLLVLIAVAAALPSGCSLGSASSPYGASTSQPQSARKPDVLDLVRMTTYRGHGIRFTYPASWRHRHRGFYSTMTSPIVDVGTQMMVDPCVRSGNSTSCWFPVRHLDRGAVVVVWSTGGLIDPAHRPVPGVHVKKLRAGCRSLGGAEEIIASVVLRGGGFYEASACLRGPGVAVHEREVRAMLASAERT